MWLKQNKILVLVNMVDQIVACDKKPQLSWNGRIGTALLFFDEYMLLKTILNVIISAE